MIFAPLLAAAALAAAETKPLLFVPRTDGLDWKAFEAVVASAPAAFTVALAPDGVPPAARAWLSSAAARGKVELALRLPSDPLAPALAKVRPGAFGEGVAMARASFKSAFGVDPAGFVAGGAALDPSSLRALDSLGFRWTAAGSGAFGRPWRAGARLCAVPFAPDAVGTPALGRAVEETSGAGAVPALTSLSSVLGAGGWTTAADALSASEPFAVAPASWPAWGGPWLEDPGARRRLELLGRAAQALESYQSSGRASVERLDEASAALLAAAGPALWAPGASMEPLVAAVRKVFTSVGAEAPDAEGREAGEVAAAVVATGVEFTNPEASTAPWRPRLLRVERSAGGLTVTVRLASLTADPSAKLGFADARAELYIDVNGLARIGSSRLIERREMLRARDAWEFAVTVAPAGAKLWRTGGGGPAVVADLEASADPASGELTAVVPARYLRGTPASWGFLLITDGEPARRPCLLGASGDQARLGAPGAPSVLKAVRLLDR